MFQFFNKHYSEAIVFIKKLGWNISIYLGFVLISLGSLGGGSMGGAGR